MQSGFIMKGDICYSRSPDSFATVPDGYVVCVDGVSKGVYRTLPEQYASLPLVDCSGNMILPGLCDLHVHASQYAFRALGMDLDLLDWLNSRTFPEETKFADAGYAREAYGQFVEDLKKGPNTRACVYATVHVPATVLLMELLEESGLVCMVGKVNMDRNCPEGLCEGDAARSIAATRQWLGEIRGRFERTTPILTPRFIPSCSDDLMREVAALQRECRLPVQSHLSENPQEVEWVKQLCPDSDCYGDAYRRFGLFGGDVPTIMAHCTWSGEREMELMRSQGVFVAHCPQSNVNLSSGIAPVREFLRRGLRVGLGSDVAGGIHCSIFRAMSAAIQVSKLRWRLCDHEAPALTVTEVFWLGSMGSGAFFGKVGSFEEGYEFDALVIDDAPLLPPFALSIAERLSRVIYLSDDRHITRKYVRGNQII